MNRPFRSILRHAAQGYALGHIGLQEYRAFRRKVLTAILAGEQPPTVPIHWLQPAEPLVQHDRAGAARTALTVAFILVLFAGAGIGAVYQYKPELWAKARYEAGKLFGQKLAGPLGEFQNISYSLVEKDVWSNTDISRAMRMWDQLSSQEQAKARSHDWYQLLMRDAAKRVKELRALEKFSSDRDSLRGQADAISMLSGALNSQR